MGKCYNCCICCAGCCYPFSIGAIIVMCIIGFLCQKQPFYMNPYLPHDDVVAEGSTCYKAAGIYFATLVASALTLFLDKRQKKQKELVVNEIELPLTGGQMQSFGSSTQHSI